MLFKCDVPKRVDDFPAFKSLEMTKSDKFMSLRFWVSIAMPLKLAISRMVNWDMR